MVSLIFACGRDPSSRPGARADDVELAGSGFYFCPVCDVYGRGTQCWWCDSPDVQWTHAPERRSLPTRIHARSMLSSWRAPNDLRRWLGPDDGEADLWMARNPSTNR